MNSCRILDNTPIEIRWFVYQIEIVVQLNYGRHPIKIRQGNI